MSNYRMEIDPQSMRQFGLNREQAEATMFFSNVTVYGIAYPAAAAMAIPVLPVYGNMIVTGAKPIATAAWGYAMTHPAETQEFVEEALNVPTGNWGGSKSYAGLLGWGVHWSTGAGFQEDW